VSGMGDESQGLAQARQVFYCWAASPACSIHFLKHQAQLTTLKCPSQQNSFCPTSGFSLLMTALDTSLVLSVGIIIRSVRKRVKHSHQHFYCSELVPLFFFFLPPFLYF
jgi:hypothetical protein